MRILADHESFSSVGATSEELLQLAADFPPGSMSWFSASLVLHGFRSGLSTSNIQQALEEEYQRLVATLKPGSASDAMSVSWRLPELNDQETLWLAAIHCRYNTDVVLMVLSIMGNPEIGTLFRFERIDSFLNIRDALNEEGVVVSTDLLFRLTSQWSEQEIIDFIRNDTKWDDVLVLMKAGVGSPAEIQGMSEVLGDELMGEIFKGL
jgi:hypothetical protein